MIAAFVLWFCGIATAAPEVVIADGPLRPGRAATLEVGEPPVAGVRVPAPAVVVRGATLRGPTELRPGVWQWPLVPALDASEVVVELGASRWSFPSAPPPPTSLVAPASVDATVRGDPVSFVVTADGPLPVDALEVVTAEGQIVGLTPVAGADGAADGVEVTVRLEDGAFPRWVPVAIRDQRHDEQPAWTVIRVRARPRIPLVAEAGAKLTLKIGSRTYGPFVAARDGALDARVDQYPGETSATAILVDDLGNETRTEVPLVSQSTPALLAVPAGELLPGRPPPSVYLLAIGTDGAPPSAAPGCRTPAAELPVVPVPQGGGRYVVPFPPLPDPSDVRVACTLGAASTAFRIGVASGVASRLSIRVWPDELLADFAVAELSVVLDDTRGERLP
ncbi:MAG: hypothetical protein ABMB14_16845, partial [Myxococcota bacterium]